MKQDKEKLKSTRTNIHIIVISFIIGGLFMLIDFYIVKGEYISIVGSIGIVMPLWGLAIIFLKKIIKSYRGLK